MAIFRNQATLIFNGRETSSNVTVGELQSGLTLTKTAVTTGYGMGDRIVYVVNIANSGAAVSGATLTDDLGSYTAGDLTLTPLDYVDGSLLYYVNGAPAVSPEASPGAPLVISGIDIPQGANVQLIYEVQTNEFAPMESGAEITNTATLNGGGIAEALSDSATVAARDDVSLTIAKALCPPVVNDNDPLTYTFIIQNSGNTEIEATDGVTVRDTFTPILTDIEVRFNGTLWTEGVEYEYDEATGLFTTNSGSITVPAASYAQSTETGAYSMTPGVSVITVSGTV